MDSASTAWAMSMVMPVQAVTPSRFAAARIDKTAGECYNTFKQQGEVQE